MLNVTDVYYRCLARFMSKHIKLYTEMHHVQAFLRRDEPAASLMRDQAPLALQLAGDCPDDLARAATLAEIRGYQEVNLNIGCPSEKLSQARLGAAMMRQPKTVQACVLAMKRSTALPITVKCRLGVDEDNCEESLHSFITALIESGVDGVIVHARKALLDGISPKENRTIPPLDHDRVHRLKSQFPNLPIVINGGLNTIEDFTHHLRHVDGVMSGRALRDHPTLLMEIDPILFGRPARFTDAYSALKTFFSEQIPLIDAHIPIHRLARHMLPYAYGLSRAREFRRLVSALLCDPLCTWSALEHCLDQTLGAPECIHDEALSESALLDDAELVCDRALNGFSRP